MEWPLIGRDDVVDRILELANGGTGVAILGVAGVGKSRLLNEFLDLAAERGLTVVSTVASASTRSIPFAPFVELLPGGPTPDELSMLGAARQELAARAGNGGLVVAVDDAHHLDGTSLAFVLSIVSSGIATVVLTARTSEPMDADLVDLWTNGVIKRIDISVLNRDDTQRLINETLGRVSQELDDDLWDLSRGNPLVLHEILEGAVGSTIQRNEHDIWVRTGSIAGSPRLSDLVKSRLRALPDALRTSLEVVSLGSPLSLGLAHEAIGDDLGRLEEGGLVDIVAVSDEHAVVPAHPLYGEILREHLGEARSRIAYRSLVEAAVASSSPTDPLRVSIWQRDADYWVSDEIALAGAQEALVRHDPALAGELLDRLNPEDDRVGLLFGRSLSYRQRFEEAEAVLTGRSPSDPTLITEIASIRGQNLAFGLRRIDAARDVLAGAAMTVDDADLRARLMNERAMVSAVQGDFRDAMSATRSVLDDADASDISRASAFVTLTVALPMIGDCIGLNEVIDDAIETANRASQVLPFARSQIDVMHLMSMVNAGEFERAKTACELALDTDETPPTLRPIFLCALMLTLTEQGLLRNGLAVGEKLLPMYADADPFGIEPQVRGLLTLVRGQLGEPDAGESVAGLGDMVGFGPRNTVWVDRGRAWAASAGGDTDVAARIALDGGHRGVAGEHFAWAAMCFHDAVRFGCPDVVVDELAAIDGMRGANYLVALQAHATALVDKNVQALARVARAFGTMNAHSLEAEAWAELAVLHADLGNETAAARSCALSKSAEVRVQGLRTPALLARPSIITDREFEVARDASSGLTSPQIAEKRFISVRTVDNHLRSVYRKLDISGRDDLATHLGLPPLPITSD